MTSRPSAEIVPLPVKAPERAASAPLAKLALAHGLQPVWTDAQGRERAADPDLLRQLLAALGVNADTDEAARSSLRDLAAQDTARGLPPVHAVYEEAPAPLLAALPADLDPDAVYGALHLEDGIELDFQDAGLTLSPVGWLKAGNTRYRQWRIDLPPNLPHGYHRLSLAWDDGTWNEGEDEREDGKTADRTAPCRLIVAPRRALNLEDLGITAPVWGLDCQLLSARSLRNWGIGDFGDLRRFIRRAAAQGAAFVGLNPLHHCALGAEGTTPDRPTDRSLLDIAYVDVAAVPELALCPKVQDLINSDAFRRALIRLRNGSQIDRPSVTDLKMEVLRLLFDAFATHELAQDTDRARQFHRFALAHDFYHAGGMLTKQQGFEVFCHLMASGQLSLARAEAEFAQMPLGLMLTLAPGEAADQGFYPGTASGVGAFPPEAAQAGTAAIAGTALAPCPPRKLWAEAYLPLIRVLKTQMRAAGALRLIAPGALFGQMWTISGNTQETGTAEAAVPALCRSADILKIVALESHRNHCMVLAPLEDLPPDLRSACRQAGIVHIRSIIGTPETPLDAPAPALMTGTHAEPTVKGFALGRDIDWRARSGDLDANAEARLRKTRRTELAALIAHLQDPDHPDTDLDFVTHANVPDLIAALADAVGRSPAPLVSLRLEDPMAELEQCVLPGVGHHPDWRRRSGMNLEAVFDNPLVRSCLEHMRRHRPAPFAQRANLEDLDGP